MQDRVKLGRDIRKTDFLLREDTVFLNNGSYGTVPRCIFNKQRQFIEEMESNPDVWYKRNSSVYVRESQIAVAQYFGADEKNMIFVENATTAINTVLKSFSYTEDDAILVSNLNYGAITNSTHRTACMFKGRVLIIDIKFPVASEDEIVQKYDDFFQRHPNIKIAVIDHISSSSAVLWPVKRLAEVCHKYDCLILVDGAHAPGQILNLNIEDLNVDFFTGNLHKWCFVPRGCAILWVSPKHHSWVKPVVTSWGHGQQFQEDFLFGPTRDYTTFATAKYFIDFMDKFGGIETVYRYNTDLITKARDYLLEEWKDWKVTKLQIPESMEAPYMRVVKIPNLKVFEEKLENSDLTQVARQATLSIGEKYGVQVAVTNIDNSFHLRVSAQIYNDMDDYKKLADVMKKLFV